MEIVYLVQARRILTEGGEVIDTWLVHATSAKEAREKVASNRKAFGEPPYFSMKVHRGLRSGVWGCLVMQEAKQRFLIAHAAGFSPAAFLCPITQNGMPCPKETAGEALNALQGHVL